MRNCVVHRRIVVAEILNRENNLQEKNLATRAHLDIEDVIRNDPNVVILNTGAPASVAEFFQPGEEVMLYGAYRGGCLKTAREALLAKGIKAYYHPTGSIPMFPLYDDTA